MDYITGIHALNLNCDLDTCGDWHQSALKWQNLTIKNSADSIYGNYGISSNITIPEHTEKYNVANHIRALLDLIDEGNFSVASGMRDDFICNGKYTKEIFEKVSELKDSYNWTEIKKFMAKEYMREWINFCKEKKI